MNCGLKRSCDVPEHVGEHEAALGVGVDDLDGLAGHRGDDVARALRVAVRHVLDEADDADDVGLRLAGRERMHQADHRRRAAHVALHVLHAGRRLDRDAAGVEDDALADEGDGLRLGSLAPFQRMTTTAAVVLRALADAEQRAHAELLHRLHVEHLDLDAEVGQRLARARRSSAGKSTFAGSLTRSRARMTPSARASRALERLLDRALVGRRRA